MLGRKWTQREEDEMNEAFSVERAIDVFAEGFSFTRSRTHPYLVERVGPVVRLHDAPRNKKDLRVEEWIAYGVAPSVVDQAARETTAGRYAISAICGVNEPDEPLRAGYKALGYRLNRTEPFFVHSLHNLLDVTSPATIERVSTQEQNQLLRSARKSGAIPAEWLQDDSPYRQYLAVIDGQAVGWVASVTTRYATWCSSMFVVERFRRQGIAKALLSRMLHDDREHGASASVLLSSHAGAKLYPLVGYEQIGTLLLFTPKK